MRELDKGRAGWERRRATDTGELSELDATRREMRLLLQLTAATGRAEHAQDVHAPALDAVVGLLECDHAAILLVDDTGVLRVQAVRGLSEAFSFGIGGFTPWPPGAGAPAPIMLADMDSDDTLDMPGREILRGEGVRSLALIPLIHAGRLLGILLFGSHRPRLVSEHEEQLAVTIASHIAQALARAQLYDAEQKARAAAELAVRAREDILAVVSHDLRNPLGAVMMTAESLLAFEGEVSDEARPKVARIKRAAHRMARLIEDLVDFGSIQAGRLTIDARTWSPADLAAAAVEILASAAEEGRVELRSAVVAGLPKVRCDRERTVQVLTNLLANAVKVTPAGGSIIVSAAPRGNEVEMCVADTGQGIEPDELPHVFERYWRSRKAAYRGSGLGLTIAGALVQAQGGRIRAESTPGRGSRFYFTLPRADLPGI